MVKDIVTTPESSSPGFGGFLTIGKTTYFVANDGVHGEELWKTDGTAKGTVLVKDIDPGRNSYFGFQNSSNIRYMTNVGGTLYFTADDGVHGQELWKSNGTAAGTVMIKDILFGEYSGFPQNLVNIKGKLYFFAYDGVNGGSLWKSNGTAKGTVPIVSMGPGSNLGSYAYVNGKFYFNGSSTIHPGYHLWYSDGTPAGTGVAAVFFPGQIEPWYVWAGLNGLTFYVVQDRDTPGLQVWSSDGSLGRAKLVHDFSSQSTIYLHHVININGELYFDVQSDTGTQLWKSDGTATGTTLVTTVNDLSSTSSSGLYNLTNLNGKLFFVTSDKVHGQEAWISDGTAGGTMVLKDIDPGADGSSPQIAAVTKNAIFFTVTQGPNAGTLWKTDGTTAGTVPLSQGAAAVAPFYFSGFDSVHGWELWRSNGTGQGTKFIKDINQTDFGSNPTSLTDINGKLYFFTSDQSQYPYRSSLYTSDGTTAGTQKLADLTFQYDQNSNNIQNQFIATDPAVFFTQPDGNFGWSLWKADGTSQGTLVKDITFTPYPYPFGLTGTLNALSANTAEVNTPASVLSVINHGPGSYQPQPINNLVDVNGTLYFLADSGAGGGVQLWKSDGTANGTVAVGSYPGISNLTAIGNSLVFLAADSKGGQGLWRFDDTTNSAVEVQQLTIFVGNFKKIGSEIYFTTSDYSYTKTFWKSDGTADGTNALHAFNDDNLGGSYLLGDSVTDVNGTVFFLGGDATTGVELWKSDGTPQGTTLVRDINPGQDSSFPSSLTNFNGALYFSASDDSHGTELWKSDGTLDGTVLVKDIYPGTFNGSYGSFANSSSPSNFVVSNGKLVFSAYDGKNGATFISDGTDKGTVELTGVPSYVPYTTSGDNVFFTSDDGVHGVELWKLNVPASTLAKNAVFSGSNSKLLAKPSTQSSVASAANYTTQTTLFAMPGSQSLSGVNTISRSSVDFAFDAASESDLHWAKPAEPTFAEDLDQFFSSIGK